LERRKRLPTDPWYYSLLLDLFQKWEILDKFVEVKATSGAHINPLMMTRIKRAIIRGDSIYPSNFTKRFSLKEVSHYFDEISLSNEIIKK
jgi:hypothetical protein